MPQRFSRDDLHDLFEQLKRFTSNTGNHGISRLAYTQEDEEAHHFFIEKAKSFGLETRQDLLGNIFIRLPGKDRCLSAVGTGSHLDTVPQGGAYDGVVGVISGLYALLQFQPQQLNRDLELIVFRAEESSRFGFSCIASKALSGKMDKAKWQNNKDDNGINLFQAVEHAGYASAENITAENCQLPENYFSAFIETHIEQGKCLEATNNRIGLVQGIAAPTRFKVEVNGHADHSGATPMGQRYDALVASTYIIQDIHLAACKESCYGTVGTVGKLDVQPNSMNVIPGKVTFSVDIRGIEMNSIQRVVETFKNSVAKTASVHQIDISIHGVSCESPVKLDSNIRQIIRQICLKKSLPYLKMISGAGHDSMNMASICPTAMIFIPSIAGVSHHPDELTEFEDIVLVSELLKDVLEHLANQ